MIAASLLQVSPTGCDSVAYARSHSDDSHVPSNSPFGLQTYSCCFSFLGTKKNGLEPNYNNSGASELKWSLMHTSSTYVTSLLHGGWLMIIAVQQY